MQSVMVRIFMAITMLFTVVNAKMFQSVAEDKAIIMQKGKEKVYCSNCGMYLPKFYKTNHFHEGHQYCSLHCLVEATGGKIPNDAKVVDTKSLKFIDTKSAYYVVGSTKKGTMTVNSKYAFANEKDAKEFAKKYGGKVVNFSKAFEIAKNDFSKDMSMLKAKKEKKIYKIGKKLLKKCSNVNPAEFNSIAKLKTYLKDNCQLKKDKQLQAVALYLWDIKRVNKNISNTESIAVPKNAKCPVCGMFVYKYPKWAAMIEVKQGKKLYFDGVKDMFKFIFKNAKSFKNIYVNDYFTTKKIDAKKAYYVFGSNVLGPMGNELIPFSKIEDAQEFKKDHFGKKILTFDQVTKELVESL